MDATVVWLTLWPISFKFSAKFLVLKHVHLKDIRSERVAKVKSEDLSFLQSVRLGAFTVPGDGSIDFTPIFAALAKAGYQGWFIVEAEQDPAIANPFEYALTARVYIRDKAGV